MKFGWIFKAYLGGMSSLGGLLETSTSSRKNHAEVPEFSVDLEMMTLAEADQKATSLGIQYRTLGIAIGLLGISIVFLAIAPGGFNLGEHAEEAVGAVKVVLMFLMLFLVFSGRRSRINREWIRMRLTAEGLRYGELKSILNTPASLPADQGWNTLRAGLENILTGEGGQIAYNAGKAHQYEAIERFADFLLWVSVALALVGAVGHLLVAWPAWIFLTAFGPAAVGGIHGINGFLGIGGLIEEHGATKSRLIDVLARLQALKELDDIDGNALKGVGHTVLEILASRDARWKDAAAKLGLKPA